MNDTFSTSEQRWLRFFILLAIGVNFSGLFIPLMDPDAGVYASLSKNLLLRGHWWELYFQGNDWLDKPHFPFWITAVFFKIFGMHTWSYKLPGILFVLLGAFYTYRFALQLYSKRVALWSVLILLTAEHIIISNNDVRAEPFLTGLVIAAIYHYILAAKRPFGWSLVLGSLFAACAVMTKGIFTLIPIGGALVTHWAITKNRKALFHPRWIAALVLVAVFISPELYSLWLQFDQHPEKIVFGTTQVSGIRFFLWDSQFGRFFNKAPMKGSGDPFFFVHTLLWAFLPWSLMMYAALISRIRQWVKKTGLRQAEWYTLGGSVLTLLVFSLSKFQLPYYANIIFPLLAVLTADLVVRATEKGSRAFRIMQYVIIALLLLLAGALHFLYRPDLSPAALLILPLGAVLLLVLLPRWLQSNPETIVFYRTVLAIAAVNLYINLIFYPDLLRYQSSSEAAFYVNRELPEERAVHAGSYAPVFEFYIRDPQFRADTIVYRHPDRYTPGVWYISDEEYDQVRQRNIPHQIIREIDEFHVTTMSLDFVNDRTRKQQLKKYYLIRIQ